MKFYKTWVIFNLFVIAMMAIVMPVVMLFYGGYIEALGSLMVGLWFTGLLFGAVHELRHK